MIAAVGGLVDVPFVEGVSDARCGGVEHDGAHEGGSNAVTRGGPGGAAIRGLEEASRVGACVEREWHERIDGQSRDPGGREESLIGSEPTRPGVLTAEHTVRVGAGEDGVARVRIDREGSHRLRQAEPGPGQSRVGTSEETLAGGGIDRRGRARACREGRHAGARKARPDRRPAGARVRAAKDAGGHAGEHRGGMRRRDEHLLRAGRFDSVGKDGPAGPAIGALEDDAPAGVHVCRGVERVRRSRVGHDVENGEAVPDAGPGLAAVDRPEEEVIEGDADRRARGGINGNGGDAGR